MFYRNRRLLQMTMAIAHIWKATESNGLIKKWCIHGWEEDIEEVVVWFERLMSCGEECGGVVNLKWTALRKRRWSCEWWMKRIEDSSMKRMSDGCQRWSDYKKKGMKNCGTVHRYTGVISCGKMYVSMFFSSLGESHHQGTRSGSHLQGAHMSR